MQYRLLILLIRSIKNVKNKKEWDTLAWVSIRCRMLLLYLDVSQWVHRIDHELANRSKHSDSCHTLCLSIKHRMCSLYLEWFALMNLNLILLRSIHWCTTNKHWHHNHWIEEDLLINWQPSFLRLGNEY